MDKEGVGSGCEGRSRGKVTGHDRICETLLTLEVQFGWGSGHRMGWGDFL